MFVNLGYTCLLLPTLQVSMYDLIFPLRTVENVRTVSETRKREGDSKRILVVLVLVYFCKIVSGSGWWIVNQGPTLTFNCRVMLDILVAVGMISLGKQRKLHSWMSFRSQ